MLNLIDYDFDSEEEYRSILYIVIESRLGVLNALLARLEIDVNARDAYSASPLHYIRYRK